MGQFFKILPNLGQNWLKFQKILEKLVILFKIWSKIGPIGIWMGYFFLKNWYLYGSTFKFHGGTSLPKPNLSTPGGQVWKKVFISWEAGKFSHNYYVSLCTKQKENPLQLPKFPSKHQHFPGMCFPNSPFFPPWGGGGTDGKVTEGVM